MGEHQTPSKIWYRKLDILYLVFFMIHIPIMLVVDLTPLYPALLRPQFLVEIRTWYIETYKDPLFVHQPAFFTTFMLLEAVYHLPLSVWAVGALLRDDPLVPIHLLIWSVETTVSTLTCTVEAMYWEGLNREEKWGLGMLYLPYLALALGMGTDMFLRLEGMLQRNNKRKIG